MQINLTGHHLDITQPMHEYVVDKFERLERHFENVTDIHVILSVDKLQHKAEATVFLRGAKLHANAIEPDMYAAIDGLIDKLDRQVIKHKEKLTDHKRR